MVRLTLLASLGLSLSAIGSAAVVDGREPDNLDDATFADTADDVVPFRLTSRNKITSKVEDIGGGINVNWTDTHNMTAKRQCIVGENPAYFAISDMNYFIKDACNSVMNGHHGKGERYQQPGTYRYLSPAYVQSGEGNPKVAVLVTLELRAGLLDEKAPFSCVNMLSHFVDTSEAGWCVTRTEKHNYMTQGGKIEIKSKPVDEAQTWGEFFGLSAPDTLLVLKVDPGKCNEKGDPCSNQHGMSDSALNRVMEGLSIGAQQFFDAASPPDPSTYQETDDTGSEEPKDHDELKL
ncbi:MAG: hypothetical protein LQ348_005683 [Seirophora lacunosa]|nr:MAG: hypothetical protein LQ344_005131 [Seirophora lacunosa]KAI4178114.1 MAG: hypothetical protein LQ348_005683 [Seirophora lacunosa]